MTVLKQDTVLRVLGGDPGWTILLMVRPLFDRLGHRQHVFLINVLVMDFLAMGLHQPHQLIVAIRSDSLSARAVNYLGHRVPPFRMNWPYNRPYALANVWQKLGIA